MTWTWLGVCVAAFLIVISLNGYRRGFIKEVVSMLFVVLALVLVWLINPYVNDFLKKNTPVYEKIHETCENIVAIQDSGEAASGQDDSGGLIDRLDLPDFLKDSLKENNTMEVYQYLSVETLTDYIAEYIAVTVFNGLSFLVSYFLATILIRMITYALDIIARLPILKGVNKLAGALLGAAKGIVFVWIACLVLTVLYNTEIGQRGLELIEQDTLLSIINDNNILAQIFMDIFYGK